MMQFKMETRMRALLYAFILVTMVFSIFIGTISAQEEEEKGDSVKTAANLIRNGKYSEAQKILLPLVNDNAFANRGKVLFLLGKSFMKQKNYVLAESYLKQAYTEYPLLDDYIASDLTVVYSNGNRYDKVVEWADKVKADTLSEEAQKLKIQALVTLDRPDEAITALDSYVRQYSQDKNARFQLASFYAQKGQNSKAVSLFKALYIESGGESKEAFEALKSLNASTLTLDENLQLAKNLVNRGKFSQAESIYQKAIAEASEADKGRINYELGMGYFNTKQYPTAAAIFRQVQGADARYYEGRSLFRAEQMSAFEELLSRYESQYGNHKGCGELLIAYAQELKRLKNFSRAEAILQKVAKNFPANKEDALWNLGWTYYKNKKYSEAAQCFTELTSTVQSSELDKYIYWEGTSLEKAGMDGLGALRKLEGKTGYYAFLARAKLGIKEVPYAIEEKTPAKPQAQVYTLIEELQSLGMDEDAIDELAAKSNKTISPDESVYLAHQALNMEQYRRTIVIANKINGHEHLYLSYPKAYWTIVSSEAGRNGLDPNLALAIMREESLMDSRALSPAGAYGLMQLMPSTAKGVAAKLNMQCPSNSDLYRPEINIKLGTYYLSRLLRDYGEHHLAIASYNAGKAPVNRWLRQAGNTGFDEFVEDISYKETRAYVKRVLRSYWEYSKISGSVPSVHAFSPSS
ncbi:MAG TPA: transglycosylase SLT domain-containing protein [Thermodesulfovibrionia bacterium]|nr:transglycosylase SLT domain-containing protein [Thermodesulfovibrionia bacterium]